MLRRALFVVPALVLGIGASSATAQQPAPQCLAERATIVGTPGNDTLTGTAAGDVIHGVAGNDTIDGGAGNDTICGGDGDDTLLGNEESDGLVGGLGNDRLDGGPGRFNAAVYLEAPGAVAVDLASGAVAGASGNDDAGEHRHGARVETRGHVERRPEQ